MSAYAMKPTFADRDGYRRWLDQWRIVYKDLSQAIRRAKHAAKATQREGNGSSRQRELHFQRAMGRKMMGLLGEARARWDRIRGIRRQIAEQMDSFPLVFEDCATIDFHFNRGHLEMPDLPMWVVKAKGRSFYVNHVNAEAPWSTRETPRGSTKGMIRFRRCRLAIDREGVATITPARRAMQVPVRFEAAEPEKAETKIIV